MKGINSGPQGLTEGEGALRIKLIPRDPGCVKTTIALIERSVGSPADALTMDAQEVIFGTGQFPPNPLDW